MNYGQFIKWFCMNKSRKKRYTTTGNLELGDQWLVNRVYNLMIGGNYVNAIVCLENIDDVFRREFIMNEVLGAKS